jgi:hypothetical protein
MSVETHKRMRKKYIAGCLRAEEGSKVEVAGVTYHGGYGSAQKLDGAYRLAQRSGATEVTFFDVDNVPHVLTLAEADAVCQAVATAYQTAFAKKQTLYAQIDAVDENAPDAKDQIRAIDW